MRVSLVPTPANGLAKPSQVMIDKAMTLRRDKVGRPFGRIEPDEMVVVERLLSVFLGYI